VHFLLDRIKDWGLNNFTENNFGENILSKIKKASPILIFVVLSS